ncbi:MAG: hypothetical protein HY698_20250 [Deltaproteobacteria bacterium]|nr:hypothetical protein [Deltaproteobacteria bacterium]
MFTRAVAACVFVAALVAQAADVHAYEPTCSIEWISVPPCIPGDTACVTRIDAGFENPAPDCAIPELLPDLDCEDARFALSPWLAGLLGLCDAPFGLGIRVGVGRHFVLTRIIGRRPFRPLPARPMAMRGDASPGHVPPPRDLFRAGAEPGALIDVELLAPSGKAAILWLPGEMREGAGYSRRIDRPPRFS